MFNKLSKRSQKDYEEKLCVGFNAGTQLVHKLDTQSQEIVSIILSSLSKKHKDDPVFQGLSSGFDYEYKLKQKKRLQQLKKFQSNRGKQFPNQER